MTKHCNRCNKVKDLSEFNNCASSADKKRSDCKDCSLKYQRTTNAKKKKELFSEYKEYIGFF